MGRNRRIKVKGSYAGYHITTRIHKREFLLNDHMKGFIVQKIKEISEPNLCFASVGGWAVMDNHLHVLVRFKHPDKIDPDSAIHRWNTYHPRTYQKNRLSEENRKYVCQQLTDVSFFMKKLKTLITREYNRITGSVGTLWERRFRSSIVENGKAMLLAAAYIDLNSFRASLVSRPEDYPYSSLWWLKKGNKGDLVSTEILDRYFHVSREIGISDEQKAKLWRPEQKYRRIRRQYVKALYKKYLRFVYECGSRPPKRELIKGRTDSIMITEQMQKRLDKNLPGPEQESPPELQQGVGLCRRLWNFTQGKFIGSRTFARSFYTEHVNPGYTKKREARHKSKWVHGLAGGVWGVFNGSRNARQEKKEDNKGNGKGKGPPI